MIEQLKGFRSGVVAFACKGRLTGSDYREVLEPAIEAALESHKRISLFYRIDPDFSGVDAGAMWEDAKVGFSHLTQWDRIAVVTDIEWIAHGVEAFAFMMPGHMKTYRLAEAEAAKAWIDAAQAS